MPMPQPNAPCRMLLNQCQLWSRRGEDVIEEREDDEEEEEVRLIVLPTAVLTFLNNTSSDRNP